ncbi:MAG: hypothetical protein IT280_00240 [Ignavibacteria bacterium]|nr:hypothetical protein [Ignavibacteria bacterium]
MKFTKEILNSKNTWQIGTGDDTRSFFYTFLKYGVALVGPGIPGKEGDISTTEFYKNNPTWKNWGAVLKNVKKGQWLIARKGSRLILAIGKVLSEYNYSNCFQDVDGWDLQHFVRVKWYRPKTKNKVIQFNNTPLSQSTLSGCNNPVVYKEIYKTEFEYSKKTFLKRKLPETVNIKQNELKIHLQEYFKNSEKVTRISKAIEKITKLFNNYQKNDWQTSESEIVSFLVLPLIFTLGWNEPNIKIEYNHIDIALFRRLFDGDYNTTPDIIVEIKQLGNGLSFTHNQINSYSKNFPKCTKFVATNGIRYKYFEKRKKKLKLLGYFNLMNFTSNVLDNEYKLTPIKTLNKIANY